MISALLKYGRDKNLYSEPGFTTKTGVKWALRFDGGGHYVGVVPLGDTSLPKNPGQTFERAPNLTDGELNSLKRGSHFLIESVEVVCGPDPAKPGESDGKIADKHAYFVKLLEEASSAVPELAGIAAALRDDATMARIRADLAEHKAKETDKATLMVGTRCIVEQESWHGWWRSFRAGIRPEDRDSAASRMVCLASGDLVVPVNSHPTVNISDVGGQSTGSRVVSFDKTAFPSYGLEQSANAAMSELTATAYAEALKHLLAHRAERLVGCKVAYWFSRNVPEEDDPIGFLKDPRASEDEPQGEARRVGELLTSVRDGRRPDLAQAEYFVLTISGSGGRVMVRDFQEGRFEEIVANVKAWFDDLTIVRRDGRALAPNPRFLTVLGSVVRDLKDVPSPLQVALWRSALANQPIPMALLSPALTRLKVCVVADETMNHARMGLLKAYHVRKGDTALKGYLNEEHPSPVYHCGRLMAVLARLQNAALGDVGAGVVQRYYAAASATPALVLGRLTRLSQFHLNKLDGGLANHYEKKIAGIWSRIRDSAPATLTLEEQTLFALGYYQQMAADWPTKKETAADSEPSEEPNGDKDNG